MEIHITGHRINVTPAIRSFTEEKLSRLERHFDKITSVNVVFDVDKLLQKAEATVHVAKGDLHAVSESENLYAAIDTLIDKLNRQLMRHKEKMLDHRDHRGHWDHWDHEAEQ